MNLRRLVKRTVTAAAFFSGLAWLRLLLGMRRKAVVLTYHRVLPARPATDAFSTDAIVVTPRTFERHMRFLRRFCHPVSIGEFSAMLRREIPWRPRTCLVTFDDGWFDNIEYALPILEHTGVPATVFVATGFIGTADTFWQERLMRLLFEAWTRGEQSRPVLTELNVAHTLQLPENETRLQLRELVSSLKSGPRSSVDDVIGRLRRSLGRQQDVAENIGDDRFMTWEQVTTLERSRFVDVESHTHSHTPLTALDHAAVRTELDRSRQELQTKLARPVRFLAYPNGDYDAPIAALTRDTGYQLAFTTERGWTAPGDDPYRLRRINVAEAGTDTTAGFLCRMLGWW